MFFHRKQIKRPIFKIHLGNVFWLRHVHWKKRGCFYGNEDLSDQCDPILCVLTLTLSKLCECGTCTGLDLVSAFVILSTTLISLLHPSWIIIHTFCRIAVQKINCYDKVPGKSPKCNFCLWHKKEFLIKIHMPWILWCYIICKLYLFGHTNDCTRV